MKKKVVLRVLSIITAMMLLIGNVLPLSASEVNVPILNIEYVEIEENALANYEFISVGVSVSENKDGFLADSFGIKYDPSLTLANVKFDNAIALTHSCSNNPELGIVWFCGASGLAQNSANSVTTEKLFTLQFTLPEDVKAGTEYPISFLWTAADESPAYWYNGDRINIIDNMKGVAMNGGIHIPDPFAPKLNETYVELGIDDYVELSVMNYLEDVIWVSDNPHIAEVNNGVVTALQPGSCTIYAMVGEKPLSCSILVMENPKYDISKTDSIYIRNSERQVILVCPPEIDPATITWLTTNEEAIRIENGIVTALKDGAATIFAVTGGTIYQMNVIVELQDITFEYGDVNEDSSVNILDVILINQNIMGVYKFDENQKLAADIYNDGTISTMDSLCSIKYVVSLLDSIPVKP